MKAHLTKKEIGVIEQITITSRDPNPPTIEYIKQSGGIFKDMMIHDFDLCRYYLKNDEISKKKILEIYSDLPKTLELSLEEIIKNVWDLKFPHASAPTAMCMSVLIIEVGNNIVMVVYMMVKDLRTFGMTLLKDKELCIK